MAAAIFLALFLALPGVGHFGTGQHIESASPIADRSASDLFTYSPVYAAAQPECALGAADGCHVLPVLAAVQVGSISAPRNSRRLPASDFRHLHDPIPDVPVPIRRRG